jgi:hypothetical protein
MTMDQPVMSAGYGDAEPAIGQGLIDLSSATTDLARLLVTLTSQSDNPGLKCVTITGILSATAKLYDKLKQDKHEDPRAG